MHSSNNTSLLLKALIFSLVSIIPGVLLLDNSVPHVQSIGIEMIGAGISFLFVFLFWDFYREQRQKNIGEIDRLEHILLHLDKMDRSLEIINNQNDSSHNSLFNYLKFLSIGFVFGTIGAVLIKKQVHK